MQTNKIEFLDDSIDKNLKLELLDHSSRYNNIKFINYSDYKILTFETYDRLYNTSDPEKNRQINVKDILFYRITAATQYKPWLVSYSAYNDPGYWWFILEFNDIIDIEEFTVNKTIQIPPLYSVSTGGRN